MSDEENHYGDDNRSEGERNSEKEAGDFESPPREDEEEKGSLKDDDDLQEMTFDKGDSNFLDDDEGGEDDDRGKKDKKKMKNLRKKVKKDGDSDGENKDFGMSDDDSDEEARKKAKTKGKRGKDKLDEETVARECDEVLQAMEEAYDRDRLSNKQKKPALEKLKYINTLAQALKKNQVQEKFLNNQGLDMMSKWLEKMPDGSPPGQTLKKKLIEIIATLPVDGEHVSNTTLSKRLYEFYKNPKEDIDLKKLLKTIIDKFSRVALAMSVDYSSQREEESIPRKRDSSYSLDENLRQEKIKNIFHNPLKPYERRVLNKRVGYNYAVVPKSMDEKDIKNKRSNSGPDFDKMYTDYKRRKKAK
mmetsp:Transcript_44801/g.51769  ORF Transcript_44801/g.51769 Transcript_44801/m.51769 type:complete len:359 (-) Transcript_44801:212-1288(-)|eukprot:CAMPEP_0176433946 /NCGR_PEP_ID=MMETSP0127-20121128/16363_1 /TAXON_ID=938130 /ORGANISM="Platyophrya macrostoma, Strain WH" /LENGTH=358 /DNA_ID=CAMNT_0017816547 /DNA_START=54 /DNA_END=1130 /DNA_ORIENTATION=+